MARKGERNRRGESEVRGGNFGLDAGRRVGGLAGHRSSAESFSGAFRSGVITESVLARTLLANLLLIAGIFWPSVGRMRGPAASLAHLGAHGCVLGAHSRVLGARGRVFGAHGCVLGAHGHVLGAHGRVLGAERPRSNVAS